MLLLPEEESQSVEDDVEVLGEQAVLLLPEEESQSVEDDVEVLGEQAEIPVVQAEIPVVDAMSASYLEKAI